MSGAEQSVISLFAEFLASKMGLRFAADRLGELEQKMAALAFEAGYGRVDKYLLWLMAGPLSREQLDLLAGNLTIGETYFLRDPKSYRLLQEEILPALVASRRHTDRTLRIWSAGCSSGEEAYSIAIVLSRAIPDIADWKISLVASDINRQVLERAERGVYGEWSFRNAPLWLMEYFRKQEDGYQVLPRIREMVRFRQLNLAEEWGAGSGIPQPLDIIFCRNVMLYFDSRQIRKTMARFHRALREDGWLFVAPTEVDHQNTEGFCCRHLAGSLVLTKQGGTTREVLPPPRFRPDPQLAPPRYPSSGGAVQAATGLEPRRAFPFPGEETDAGAGSPTGSEGGAAEASSYEEALPLYRAGRYLEAAELVLSLQREGGTPPDGRGLALAARALANIGSFDVARDCCRRAIACDRLSADNHYLLAIILEQLGDASGAVLALKQALYIDPAYPLAYFALGNLERQQGKGQAARRNLGRALTLLKRRDPQEVLEEADGMTAGGLAQIIQGLEARS